MLDKYSNAGNKNLLTINKSNNFTQWLYSQIKPFLRGNILEIGSGIGTYSIKISKEFKNNNLTLSDIDKNYVQKLNKKFSIQKNIKAIKLDLNNEDDFKKIDVRFDSIFALNVMEHIGDDIAALNRIYRLLKPNGNFIMLVPAHKQLFNCIDEAVGHYRRYTKQEIKNKILKTNFKIKQIFYFNFLSIFGWYVNGNILKKETINENAMNLFNKIVPALNFVEKYILRKKIGISLITVLKK